MDQIKDSRRNKGLSYSIKERQVLSIHGLLPPIVETQDKQVERVLTNVRRIKDELDKYMYLMNLLDRDERLFYCVLENNVEEIMPLVYTPTVGAACTNYGLIYTSPKGMFISINDRGHIYEVLRNWPVRDVKVIVVTDGERILGLGDLGAQGMGIPVGKLALYTALAGVNPKKSLPIQLDVGTNNDTLLNDPFYIGLRQKRITGHEYYEFIEEFMVAVKRRFGSTCLIQFEDFGNHHAFKLLDKYQKKYCTFNDDIQGTASVALAGLFTSIKFTKTKLVDNTFLFYGAGEAAIGTANLIVLAMTKHGLTEDEARKRIWLVDSKGLIVKDRPEGGLNHEKLPFAKDAKPMKSLVDIIGFVKPNAIIGCAAVGQVFNQIVLEKMAELNERPIIFALSNPTSKAECTAEEAYISTKGKAVFASGSPFNKVTYNGKEFYPGQGNNCYIFPAVGLAVVACSLKHVTDEFFLVAAESLSEQVTQQEMDEGRVYPNLNRIKDVSFKIAVDVAKYAIAQGLCTLHPHPDSLEDHIRSKVYVPRYVKSIKETWEYPGNLPTSD